MLGSTDAQLRHDYKLGKQAGSAFLESANKEFEANSQPVASFIDVTVTRKGIRSKDGVNHDTKSEHASSNGKRPIMLPFPARVTRTIDKVDKENRILA